MVDVFGRWRKYSQITTFIMLAMVATVGHARDLPEILRDGLMNDPGVREAQANEKVAESVLAQSEAAKWPTVAASGNQSILRSDSSDERTFQPALQAQWTIYDFGKRKAQVEHDEIKTTYFKHKTKETEQEFLYELAGHYLEALRAKMQLEVAHKNLSRHQEIVRKLNIIVEYDPGRRSELTQAEARLLQVRETIISNQRLQALALSRISRYVVPAVEANELRDPFSNLSSEKLVEKYPLDQETLKLNPSYVAQAKELDSANAELEMASLSRWPDINLQGEANRHDSAVYLSVKFDVFDRKKSPDIDEKRFQVEAAQARLDKILYNLQERAQIAILEMQEDQVRIDIADNQIKTLEQVTQDYEDQFEIAARSLLDVLNSYNELASIEQIRTQAIYDLMKAKLDYLSAAGQIAVWANIDTGIASTPSAIVKKVSSDSSQYEELQGEKPQYEKSQYKELDTKVAIKGKDKIVNYIRKSKYYFYNPEASGQHNIFK